MAHHDHDHDHDHDKCLALFEKLSEYLDDELDSQECRRIEDHIRDCCHCHICFETLKRTVDFCRHAHEDPIPSSLSNRLGELIRDLSGA
jgi:anti-sigma factor RsiW